MKPVRRLTILYGSQTGNAQSIAEGVHSECASRGIESVLLPLNEWKKLKPPLESQKVAVIIVSTTGNGDPPENCDRFWRHLKRRTHPKDVLEGVHFAMLGLGDSNYDKFCHTGKSMNTRLRELGAEAFYPLVCADEALGLEDFVEPWLAGLWPALDSVFEDVGDGTSAMATDGGTGAGADGTAAPAGQAAAVYGKAKLPPLSQKAQETTVAAAATAGADAPAAVAAAAGPAAIAGAAAEATPPSTVNGVKVVPVAPGVAIVAPPPSAPAATSSAAISASAAVTAATAIGGDWANYSPCGVSGVRPLDEFLAPGQSRSDLGVLDSELPNLRALRVKIIFKPSHTAGGSRGVRSGGGKSSEDGSDEAADRGDPDAEFLFARPARSASMEGMWTAEYPYPARALSARYLTLHETASAAAGTDAAAGGDGDMPRRVVQLELGLAGSGIQYGPGDAIGVRCPNPPGAVAYVLRRLAQGLPSGVTVDTLFWHGPGLDSGIMAGISGAVPAAAAGGAATLLAFPSPCSLREAVTRHLDLQAPPRKQALRALAEHCGNSDERRTLLYLSSKKTGHAVYSSFVQEQSLMVAELLEMFPSCLPPVQAFLALLPPLPPRYYSVASSQLACPSSLSVAFSCVEYNLRPARADGAAAPPVRRRGLCTSWLEGLVRPLLQRANDGSRGGGNQGGGVPAGEEGMEVPIFVKPTKEFQLPASPKWPIILIGPGTGVAPFIGFLQHREWQRRREAERKDEVCTGFWRGGYEIELEGEEDDLHQYNRREGRGDIWLFFGCRHRDTDWIFREDMERFLHKGVLAKLFLAFSRDLPAPTNGTNGGGGGGVDGLSINDAAAVVDAGGFGAASSPIAGSPVASGPVEREGEPAGPAAAAAAAAAARPKQYVQQRIEEQGEGLYRKIEMEGAYVYVCGDGNQMAKDVHAALRKVLARHSGLNTAEAEEKLRSMKDRGRYVLDVWS